MGNLQFLNVKQTILDSSEIKTITVGEDLDHTFNKIDRINSAIKLKPLPTMLTQFLKTIILVDRSCPLFPNDRDYSFHSNSKNSYSNLDYIFISKTALNEQ